MKRHTEQCWRGSHMQFLCPLPVESRHQPAGTSMCSLARKLTWASVSRIFIGVLLPIHGWFNYWSCDVTELNLQPFSVPRGWASSNPLIARLVFPTSHPESSPQQKTQAWITKTLQFRIYRLSPRNQEQRPDKFYTLGYKRLWLSCC